MTIVVIHQAEGVVVVFRRETEGVFEMEVAVGDDRGVCGTSDSSKGGVIVVCRNAIARFKMDESRNVLIAIKGIEEFVASRIGEHEEQACGHGFG